MAESPNQSFFWAARGYSAKASPYEPDIRGLALQIIDQLLRSAADRFPRCQALVAVWDVAGHRIPPGCPLDRLAAGAFDELTVAESEGRLTSCEQALWEALMILVGAIRQDGPKRDDFVVLPGGQKPA